MAIVDVVDEVAEGMIEGLGLLFKDASFEVILRKIEQRLPHVVLEIFPICQHQQ